MDSLTEGDEELADQQSEDGDQDFENNSKSSLTPGGDNQLDMDIESLVGFWNNLYLILWKSKRSLAENVHTRYIY